MLLYRILYKCWLQTEEISECMRIGLDCKREWPVRRYRFEHLPWTRRPAQPMVVVNWCGHGQEFVPWPDEDGYWTLLPVVEAVANRLTE